MADTAFTWQAQPVQRLFLQQKCYEAMMGGAAGGGKSDTLLMFNIARRLKYPGSSGLMLRRSIEELKKEGSLIPRSHEILSGKWAWSGQDKKWRAPNGSTLEFGYCKYESDVYHYQSAQYADIEFDELTHFTNFQYEYIKSRVRSAAGFPVAIRSATNPGNIGHAWVKKYFVNATVPGQEYIDPNTGKGRVFIPARVYDNATLMKNDPGYVERLKSLPEHERRALLDGDWDVFKGQYFYEWRYDKHVIKPFPIPPEWPRERTMDWGMAKPLACYWIAMAPDGRAYVYREYYATGRQAADAGRDIKELSKGEQYVRTWCDPSMFAKKGEGMESIAAQMQRSMGTLMPSKNERVSGWQAVRKWLSLAPDEMPYLQFFDTCVNAVRTFPELIYDTLRVEDLDTDGEDHACFCGHTPILTKGGYVAIMDVKKGDLVWTPLGWSKVLQQKMTGQKPVKNFRGTKATQNHPFLTQDGLVPLKNLTWDHRLLSAFISSENPIGGTPAVHGLLIEHIFGAARRSALKQAGFFTSTYGNLLMGQYQKAFSYTIGMVILPIMLLRILKWSILPSITRDIKKHIWKRLEKMFYLLSPKRRNGIGVLLEKHGIVSTQEVSGKRENQLPDSAWHVNTTTQLSSQSVRNSVVSTAKCLCSGCVEVYNLETDTGLYTAGTVVVSNCDAIRYWAVNHHKLPKHPTAAEYPGLPGHHAEFWERFKADVRKEIRGKNESPLAMLDF